MEGQGIKLPIGTQTFSILREEEYTYVDKTEYVYRMTHGESRYLFLSRPRRFGKSLLVSTLRSYFEGRKDLFEGLKIAALEKEWTAYPVLHFDMSRGKRLDKAGLEDMLNVQLYKHEKVYGEPEKEVTINDRMSGLIERAYKKYGQKVVVLIDEYDAPLLDVVHEEENLPALRDVMRNFYSPLKACDPYLRFVFMTGITKFSQLSIFSELNNIKNISMDKGYAAICGITEEEIRTYLSEGVRELAEENELSYEGAMEKLKENYDGYKFTWPSDDLYNPYSLLNALCDKEFESYWFGSGTPTYLIEMLRKFNVNPQDIGHRECQREDFDQPTERMTDITPLLYQSGYITIKECDRETMIYTLDIPNKEVRVGLMRSLLPQYLEGRNVDGANTMVIWTGRWV